MTERRSQTMSGGPGAVYSQWEGYTSGTSTVGGYPAGHHQYPSSSYVTHSSPASLRPGQASPSSYQTVMADSGGYQSPDRQSSPYNTLDRHRGGLPAQTLSYHPLDPAASQGAHHPAPALQQHPSSPPQQAPLAYSHPRSLQAHASVSYPSPPPPHPAPHPAAASPHYHSQYSPSQVPYALMDNSSQYPASPQRPFSCDLCALSFNRQHDLKRHRDTHTGEKPFLCNGGCGKTFTRKDALKRHQVSLHPLPWPPGSFRQLRAPVSSCSRLPRVCIARKEMWYRRRSIAG